MNYFHWIFTFLTLILSPNLACMHPPDDLKKELFQAVQENNQEKVITLLNQGISVHTIKNNKTPLHHVKSAEIAQLLIKNGANVNAVDDWQQSLLFYAIHLHNIQLVETLLKYGASINITNKGGSSVLHQAALLDLGHDTLIIQLLLRYQANANVRDSVQRTPLFYVHSKQSAQLLVQVGALINAHDIFNQTPLYFQLYLLNSSPILYMQQDQHKKHIQLIKYLLDNRALLDTKTNGNSTRKLLEQRCKIDPDLAKAITNRPGKQMLEKE